MKLQAFETIQILQKDAAFREHVDTSFDFLIGNLSRAIQRPSNGGDSEPLLQSSMFDFLQEFIKPNCNNFTLDNTEQFVKALVAKI